MNVVSRNIRKLLAEHGMTQRELAEDLGVCNQAVANWANGICAPSHNRIKDVCKALGVDPNYLYGWEDDND